MEQNRQNGAGESTFFNIEKLSKPETSVVIGGQQTGLFMGPLYTLYKALSVIKLARELSVRLKKDVVPVFWMASDDHDFAEINHIYLPDLGGNIQKIDNLKPDSMARLPVSKLNIAPEINKALAQLNEFFPKTEFSSPLLSTLTDCYRSEFSYPDAFASLMHSMLKKFGLILVDPSDRRLKQIAIPLFKKEIEEGSPITDLVLSQTELLKKHGFSAQINLHKNIYNLFYHTPQRESISKEKDKYLIKNRSSGLTRTEIVGLLEQNPENFSPNAVFRPLYQDTLFPTLAVVLGPSEIAYFAQLGKAYCYMNIPMPIIFPRVSATLVEPRAERLLKKYHLTMTDIFSSKEKIIDILIQREIPQSLFTSIEQSLENVSDIWHQLAKNIIEFDPNLKKTVEIASFKSLGQFEFINKKIIQAARKKDELLKTQTEKLINLIYPFAKPQERVFNFLPYYCRFGHQLIDNIYQSMEIFNPDHQIIYLSTENKD